MCSLKGQIQLGRGRLSSWASVKAATPPGFTQSDKFLKHYTVFEKDGCNKVFYVTDKI